MLHSCAWSLAGPTRLVGQSESLSNSSRYEPTYLVLRRDDAGMTHSVNLALELDALRSKTFKDALNARDVRLLTFRQLITMQAFSRCEGRKDEVGTCPV